MRIQLILKDDYDTFIYLQKEYPIFTFENVGYEYIDKKKFNNDEKEAFEYISGILRQHIVGFSEFNNFCHDKNGNLKLRFQYDWTAHDRSLGIPFTGAGYILLDELLNGFPEETKQI